MKNVLLQRIFFAVSLLAAYEHVNATVPTDLLNAGYVVYTADVNGDGCPDYLIKAPNRFVPISIDDDLTFVIPIPSKLSTIQLTSVGTCGSMTLSLLPPSITIDPRWIAADYTVIVGDVVGQSGGSLFIAPTTSANSFAFSISRSPINGSFTYLQSLQLSTFGIGNGTHLTLQYINGDSRTDLVATNGIQIVAAFVAGSDGRFTTGSSDKASLATLVWKSFLGALGSANPSSALALVSGYSTDVFSAALATPGATPQGFPSIVNSFEVIEVQDTYVRGVISIQRNGESDLFYVLFGLDSDGYWKIYSL